MTCRRCGRTDLRPVILNGRQVLPAHITPTPSRFMCSGSHQPTTEDGSAAVELAGWAGLVLGLLAGLLVAAVLTDGPARCHEDEVATWPMKGGQYVSYENTQCVPLDEV